MRKNETVNVHSQVRQSVDLEAAAEAVGGRPETAIRLMQLAGDDDSTAGQIQEVVDADPSIAMRTLKLANSAFYGLPSRIARIDRAVTMLGCATIARLATTASVSATMRRVQIDAPGIQPDTLWRFSASVAFCTETIIAECHGLSSVAQRKLGAETFALGLIHEVGILVQSKLSPPQFTEAVRASLKSGVPLIRHERRLVGIDHADIGMRLARHWNLPAELAAGIGFHHDPLAAESEHKTLACIVHIAMQLARKAGVQSFDGDTDMPELERAMDHVHLDARRVDKLVALIKTKLNSVPF